MRIEGITCCNDNRHSLVEALTDRSLCISLTGRYSVLLTWRAHDQEKEKEKIRYLSQLVYLSFLHILPLINTCTWYS